MRLAASLEAIPRKVPFAGAAGSAEGVRARAAEEGRASGGARAGAGGRAHLRPGHGERSRSQLLSSYYSSQQVQETA